MICKTHDYIHHYHGCWRPGGICRIQILQEEGCAPVIICTALPENDDTGIQVMTECLAAEIALAHFPARFELIGEPFVWIEYHPAGRTVGTMAVYLWVTFDSYAPRQVLRFDGTQRVALGQAHWTRLDPECIEDRQNSRSPLSVPSAG